MVMSKRSLLRYAPFSGYSLSLSLLLVGMLTSTGVAQTTPSESAPFNGLGLLADESIPQKDSNEARISEDVSFSPRFGVGYSTSGAGFDAFTSFEGFVPLLQNAGSNLTFLEGRLLWSTNNSTLGGNVLLGHRFYNSSDNRIFGGYVSYDNRNTGNAVFNQIGTGFESLGENWDFRINAYIPVGDTRQVVEENVFDTGLSVSAPFFTGNFLSFLGETSRQINRRLEAAMAGFDFEAGAKIASLGDSGDIRGYAGLYYYDANGSDVLGWRTRLEVRPTDSLRLGLSVQDDATFGTNVVLSVAAFPGSRPRGSRNQTLARMGESVARQVNIVVDEQFESETIRDRFTVLATNPNTNEPYFFQHVNLDAQVGNGTFELPFGTLQDALNVAKSDNIIYVQPGKNSTEIPAFTLPNNVALLSTAPVQNINGVVLPLSGAGVQPIVTGGVTLGNNNTISGFAIANPNGAGITGNNISNPTIRENAIANTATDGIRLDNPTGKVTISNNNFSNIDGNGISINTANSQSELVIDSNIITRDISGFGFTGIKIVAGDDTVTTATISNNQISESMFRGIQIDALGNSQTRLLVESNTISGSQFNGITINADENAQISTSVRLNTLINNNVVGAFGGGEFDAQTYSNSSVCLQLDNNKSTPSTNGEDYNLANNNVGGSTFQVEDTLATNTGTVTENPAPLDFPKVPRGTCGFP